VPESARPGSDTIAPDDPDELRDRALPAESEDAPAVLRAEHVGVSVRSANGARGEILRDLSLTIAAGEVLAIVGESGCGKSTLASAVAGLPPPGAEVTGRIVIGDEDIVSTSERRRRQLRGRVVGFVPQDHIGAFNPVMTIERHLMEGPRAHLGLSRREARTRARDLLTLVELDPSDRVLKAHPHQLSGGMRQRVMIAAAMACGPSLIVADEPTTALDVTVQASILHLLAELCRTRSIGLMLISHDLSVVAQVADHVAVLYSGEVVESGRTDVLLHRPRHPYTEALLSAVPDPQDRTVRRRRLTTIPGRPPDIHARPDGCWFAPRCPYATEGDRCLTEHPTLTELAPGHWASTFHPREPGTSLGTRRDDEEHYGHTTRGSEPILRVSGLTKRYGGRHNSGPPALQEVSIELFPGQTLGLIGGSGSGKSTLAQCVLQLNGEYTGTITFDGRGLEALDRRAMRGLRRELQVIFQDARNSLDPRLTIRNAIAEALQIHEGRTPDRLRQRVEQALAHVGLPDTIADRYPRQCSGGELQRVCIARALILKPRLLICDEAVSSLDVSTRAQILNLLRDLQEENGISLLFITHDFGPVAAMSDVIGVLHDGRLVECGPAGEVLRAPTDDYTRELIAAVPRLEDRFAEGADRQ
jgi:peptide/nickel transport system ATP-binding protein